ncbi:MAG: HEAT repeat domain-containing protein [Deltaproteobacteria bacterium]|nr:HEAT repeat domain-containing protein [Deltaproteobacteria bacterium]
MSLKALFSKDGRKERALQKASAKAANKKIKPDDRGPALHTLLEDGSDEAIAALFKRFTFIYDANMVSDEEEKNLVYQGLVDLGERVLPHLRQHLTDSPTLSWGLRMLGDVCDHETSWSVLEEVLASYEPGYVRDPSKKQQLIGYLGDFKDVRAAERLVPFLEDHDETVRYLTVEGLFNQRQELAREALLKAFCNADEESLRIKNRIAEGFAETGWAVTGFRGTVEGLLGSDYLVDGKGKIKLKKARTQP